MEKISQYPLMPTVTAKEAVATDLMEEWEKDIQDTVYKLVFKPQNYEMAVLKENIGKQRKAASEVSKSKVVDNPSDNPYKVVDSFFTWAFEPERVIDHLSIFGMYCSNDTYIVRGCVYYKTVCELLTSMSIIHITHNIDDIPLSLLCNLMFQRIDYITKSQSLNIHGTLEDLKSDIKGLMCYLVPILDMIKSKHLTGSTLPDKTEVEELSYDLYSHGCGIETGIKSLREKIRITDTSDDNEKQSIRELFFMGEVVVSGFRSIISYVRMYIQECNDPMWHFDVINNSLLNPLARLIHLTVPKDKLDEFLDMIMNPITKITFKTYESLAPYLEELHVDAIKDGNIDLEHYKSTFIRAQLAIIKANNHDVETETKNGLENVTIRARQRKMTLILVGISVAILTIIVMYSTRKKSN